LTEGSTIKIIVGFGIVGAMAVAGYLAVIPIQYEAKLQLEMAQVRNSNSNSNSNNSLNTLGVSIEPPSLLVGRLAQPATYTLEAIRSCAIQDGSSPHEAMASIVEASIPRNVPTVVEIVVRRDSAESAAQCATALFEMIRAQQAALIEPYLEDERKVLASLQMRLKENQDFISRMDKVALYQTVYLTRRDQMLYLMNQIDGLERMLSQTVKTRLVTPVYASHNPVPQKKKLSLALGAMAGLMLGVFFALGRNVWSRGRANE
jgi:hypothetical protein